MNMNERFELLWKSIMVENEIELPPNELAQMRRMLLAVFCVGATEALDSALSGCSFQKIKDELIGMLGIDDGEVG